MSKEHNQDATHSLMSDIKWKIGFVAYIGLVMITFFPGTFQGLLSGAAYSYRPEDIWEVIELICGIVIAVVPLAGLGIALRRQKTTLVEHISKVWREYPNQMIEIAPFIWLFVAAVLRYTLALTLLLPLPSNIAVEMSILVIQWSVLIVLTLSLLAGLFRATLSKGKAEKQQETNQDKAT